MATNSWSLTLSQVRISQIVIPKEFYFSQIVNPTEFYIVYIKSFKYIHIYLNILNHIHIHLNILDFLSIFIYEYTQLFEYIHMYMLYIWLHSRNSVKLLRCIYMNILNEFSDWKFGSKLPFFLFSFFPLYTLWVCSMFSNFLLSIVNKFSNSKFGSMLLFITHTGYFMRNI